MSDAEEAKFSLKVMINKEKTKVLFAESDGHFVDVLLSFLTLPLGGIVKLLEKHFGDEAPIVGCLNTLYKGVANLDSPYFCTEGAKLILLNPSSSFDLLCRELKLDISDSKREWFFCEKCPSNKFWSQSIYYDKTSCKICGANNKRAVGKKVLVADRKGVFTIDTATFIITDDLQIVPNAIGLVQTASILDITGVEGAEVLNVTFGLSEIMNLLRASMISQTPLSDLLLDKTRKVSPERVESQSRSEASLTQIKKEENPNSKKMMLKVTIQKSTNKLLFAQAKEDFVEFLFSLLTIPLGGVECLLASNSCIKSIDNLYRSVTDLIDDQCFKTSYIKQRLIEAELPHGSVSEKHILPLKERSLEESYDNNSLSSVNFPQGQGNYMKGAAARTYQVLDDLTVLPFYISSILCSLGQQRIPVSDVKELEMAIGLDEALSILRASLTSNSALTNGLLNRIPNKQPKQET